MVSKTEKAFTLTELLIVIGLLVLMMVLALPAVNFITGSRSTESATNVVGALLGSARSQAIAKQSNVGVLFFWDRTKEQTVAGLCAPAQPWDSTASYVGGDVVEFPPANGTYYICKFPVVGPPYPSSASNPNWAAAISYSSSMPVLLDGYEIQTLPKGVGLQAIVIPNQNLETALSNPPTTFHQYDTYVSTACVMFDGEGRLTFTQYGIYAGENLITPATVIYSKLYALLRPDKLLGNSSFGSQNISNMGQTQLAIALYDRHTFHDAGYDENDYLAGDFNTSPPTAPPNSPGKNLWSSQAGNEPAEEGWIDNNSTFLLVNRYNGTLLKSE